VTLVLALAMAKDPSDRIRSPLAFTGLLEQAAQGRLDETVRRRAQALYRPDLRALAAADTLAS
jgi:hypothetical protein